MKKLKVIISGGGTGGHIFPAISIARAILEVVFVNYLILTFVLTFFIAGLIILSSSLYLLIVSQ